MDISREDAFEVLKKNVLPLIQNKVFLGRYIERRYVESLEEYRDIIVVESSEDIAKNLMKARKALEAYSNGKWIGISNDPQNIESDDCLLWVQLKDVPIGKHWFQMSAIRFDTREIILEIQYVQSYRSPDKSFVDNDPNFPTIDFKEILTYQNLCEVIKFSVIVLMALFTFAVEALRYLGEYSIKLSHVIVNLVHVSTPICLGMFEFMTKCVAGFYWLIYVMFRGTPNTPIVPAALLSSNQRQSRHDRSFRSLEYRQNNYPRHSYNSDWNKYQR